MNEQVPSDSLLSRLRKLINPAHLADCNVSLHPDQLFALLECAEALTHVNNSHDTRMNSMNWQMVQNAVTRLETL